MSSMSAVPAGPDATAAQRYYPPGVALPGFVANTLSTPTLLAIFGAACAAALVPAYAVLRRAKLPSGDVAAGMWFVLCGCIHLVLEGHFARNAVAPSNSVLSQLWKEYALSDSRYLTRDAFVTVMEGVTAFCWGPLSFVIAWTIAARHPARHLLQTVVSLGQFYGVVLYYGTCLHDAARRGLEYSRPEAYYFYGYYILTNAFWVVIPLYLLARSARAITAALALAAADDAAFALGSPRAAKWKA